MTVKPIDLMRHLVRLVTPPGGVTLDPFAGSGTTGLAASEEGFRAILIEREPEYAEIIVGRLMATPMGLGLDVGAPEPRKRKPAAYDASPSKWGRHQGFSGGWPGLGDAARAYDPTTGEHVTLTDDEEPAA